VNEFNRHPGDLPDPVVGTGGANASARRQLICFLPHPPDSWGRCLFRMALWVDLGCVAFFFILTILGILEPYIFGLMDEINWVGWCKGLNLGMGSVVVVAGMSQWKQKPAYAITGVLLGACSICLSAASFASVK